MFSIFDKLIDYHVDNFEKNINNQINNMFHQCKTKLNYEPLVYNTTSFTITDDNKYLAEIRIPSFVNADMINVDINDEKRILTISYNFKNNVGLETSSAMTELLPNDADIETLTAVFDNGNLTLTMNKIEGPKTINVHHN